MTNHVVTAAVAIAAAIGAMLLASPDADASPLGQGNLTLRESTAPLSLLCEHRSSAHVAEHGGMVADNAWHVSHGDLPTCDTSEQRHDSSDDNDDEPKSRYCRRHWYC